MANEKIKKTNHQISNEVKQQDINNLRVSKNTLKLLISLGCKSIGDAISQQDKLNDTQRGEMIAYLVFGMDLSNDEKI